jgi:hypothetical protein
MMRERVAEALVDAFVDQNAHLGACEQKVLCFFEGGDGGCTGDGGKAIEKVLEGFSAFEVVEESLQGHTGAAEDGSSAEDVQVSDDDVHSGIVARGKSRGRARGGMWV